MSKACFAALDKQDIALLERLIDGDSLIDGPNEFGYSLLHVSIAKSYDLCSIFLIDKGINLNIRDKNGQTALHYVALYNKLHIATSLLEKGADIKIEDNYGNQPLWTAVFNDKGFGRRIEIIKLFLEYGADINHKNTVGRSPLDFAKIANYSYLVDILSNGK